MEMKKIVFALLICLSFSCSYSQRIQLKGKIVCISKKQIVDTGNVTLSVDCPMHTFFTLSDEKLIIDNLTKPIRYRLFAKDTITINNEMVISYLSDFGDRLKLIAVSEISGNPNHIKLAIFPFTGSLYYTEYLLRLAPPKRKTK